jgi:hypothetical protein
MILSTILKKTVQILATNPVARKKAGEIAIKAYKSAKPVIEETKKTIYKKTILKKKINYQFFRLCNLVVCIL